MSRLEEIKNEYAKEFDYKDWTSFINDQPNYAVENHMNDICTHYAKECSQASLEKSSDKLCEHFIDEEEIMVNVANKYCNSITNPENIVLL